MLYRDLSEPAKERARQRAKDYYWANKDRIRLQHQVYYQNNQGRLKEYSRQYQARKRGTRRLEQCTVSACEICNTEFTSEPHRGPHWDHDHQTGKFRGWLCLHCNVALGHFSDSPELLQAAITYLITRKVS